MSTTILVTGATGTIGSKVIDALTGKPGVQVRAAVRSAAKAEGLRRANVTPVDFDYGRPETITAAVQGADVVFLLTPFTDDQVELGKRLIDAAKAAGVKRVVKISAAGAEIEPGIQLGRWHRETEKHLEASGLAWTILRPATFMDNFVNFYPPGADGNIYLPFGAGAVSWIDTRDIADVAARVLTTDGHDGKAYELTGPEALSIEQIARAISEVSGRAIRYVDVPEEAARKAMLDMGYPSWAVEAMLELHAISKAGYAAGVTDAVQRITGEKPRTFADFARDNAARWSA